MHEHSSTTFEVLPSNGLDALAAADPGFPQGGANSPGGRQHTILPNFPENCMKSKEFGRPGGGGAPLNPPLLGSIDCTLIEFHSIRQGGPAHRKVTKTVYKIPPDVQGGYLMCKSTGYVRPRV